MYCDAGRTLGNTTVVTLPTSIVEMRSLNASLYVIVYLATEQQPGFDAVQASVTERDVTAATCRSPGAPGGNGDGLGADGAGVDGAGVDGSAVGPVGDGAGGAVPASAATG